MNVFPLQIMYFSTVIQHTRDLTYTHQITAHLKSDKNILHMSKSTFRPKLIVWLSFLAGILKKEKWRVQSHRALTSNT